MRHCIYQIRGLLRHAAKRGTAIGPQRRARLNGCKKRVSSRLRFRADLRTGVRRAAKPWGRERR